VNSYFVRALLIYSPHTNPATFFWSLKEKCYGLGIAVKQVAWKNFSLVSVAQVHGWMVDFALNASQLGVNIATTSSLWKNKVIF